MKLGTLLTAIRKDNPDIKIYAFEHLHEIYISSIQVPEEQRGKGIGSGIIRRIQDYAQEVGKPVTLRPQAERGYKKKLETFYMNLGFVHNKGRNKDYALTSPFGASMYWRPKEQ